MRLIGLLLLTASLGACDRGPGPGPALRHGDRYLGIGLYAPGEMWRRLAGAARSGDESTATLRDDEQVIVVVDSRTGEIRQCGNLSGHCLRMNPWSGQPAPARVSEHRAEPEQGDVVNEAAPAETEAAGR